MSEENLPVGSITFGTQSELDKQAAQTLADLARESVEDAPLDMLLFCPQCGEQHIDEPSEGWDNPPHRSHACQFCSCIWRPSDAPTNGVLAIASKGGADTHAARPRYFATAKQFDDALASIAPTASARDVEQGDLISREAAAQALCKMCRDPRWLPVEHIEGLWVHLSAADGSSQSYCMAGRLRNLPAAPQVDARPNICDPALAAADIVQNSTDPEHMQVRIEAELIRWRDAYTPQVDAEHERLKEEVLEEVRQCKYRNRPLSEYGFSVELERAAVDLLAFEGEQKVKPE